MIACGDDRFHMMPGVCVCVWGGGVGVGVGVCVCVCVCVCVLHLNNNSLKFPKVETDFKSYSNFKNS
jgi:hypothetical protein